MNEEKRKDLIKMREYSEKEFDRLIVYISTGAIAFTTGFIKDIIKVEEVCDKSLLIMSWVSFAISLFLILISHRASTSAIDKLIVGNHNLSKIYNKLTIFINYLSLIILFLGILFFIIFISINL